MNRATQYLLLTFFGALLRAHVLQAQIVVTSTADSGPGTLREAVATANASPVAESITFDGALLNQVILLDNPITILPGNGDGTSISGDIDGDQLPSITIRSQSGSGSGLVVAAQNVVLEFLHLDNFGGAGNAAVSFSAANSVNNTIRGCFIGTDITGTAVSPVGGNFRGIAFVDLPSGINIGDGTAEGRNVISNNSFGIYSAGVVDVLIRGNIIGLDVTGSVAIPNGGDGIFLNTGSGGVIGGTNALDRNIISANSNAGISIQNVSGMTIEGNYIGTDATGLVALGNAWDGIALLAGSSNINVGTSSPGSGNVISGNGQSGIEINFATDCFVQGNTIGLGSDGDTPVPNTGDGIFFTNGATTNLIGGDRTAGEGNVISGNGGRGILMGTNGNLAHGNYIGLASDGTTGRGNAVAGIVATGNSNQIGRGVTGFQNVIADNAYGIGVLGQDNIIHGNYIGTDAAGTLAVPNSGEGIRLTTSAQGTIIGDAVGANRNVISGNLGDGVTLSGAGVDNNNIGINLIGIASDGSTPLGNGGNGISLSSGTNMNLITLSSIANNTGFGILASGGTTLDNVWTQNLIFDNGSGGISVAAGAQSGIISPVISNVAGDGTISGTADLFATVEVFLDDGSEGEVYYGTANADDAGLWSLALGAITPPPGVINLTATQLSLGNASEFSAPFPIPGIDLIVTNTNDSGPGSLRNALSYANSNAGADVITFNIPTTDPNYAYVNNVDTWTIPVSSALPTIVETVTIDGASQPGGSDLQIIVDGSNSFHFLEFNSPGEALSITELVFKDGYSPTDGGAMKFTNGSSLSMDGTAFSSNHSDANGGAIYISGAVTTFLDNIEFTNNTAAGGGAIAHGGSGLLSIDFANFLDNHALTTHGGALYAIGTPSFSGEGLAFIRNQAPSGNGGAMFVESSSHSMFNVTFSGNLAQNGGAVYMNNASGSFNFSSATFFQNQATTSGGGIYINDGTVSLKQTIVAGNTGGDIDLNSGAFSSQDYNFIGYDPGTLFPVSTGDQVGSVTPIDPHLAPLQHLDFAGRSTYFHNPLEGSPVVNMGLASDLFWPEDQRGLPRVVGAEADIGAVELDSYTVVAISPAPNSINNAVTTEIDIEFSSDLFGSDDDYLIVRSQRQGLITGSLGNDDADLNFQPDSPFLPGDLITVYITRNVTSLSGYQLSEPISFQFTTASDPGPDNPPHFEERVVVQPFGSPFRAVAADVNSDGHMDIVATASSDSKVSWFENDGVLGFTERIITTNTLGVDDVYLDDVDLDGDLDIITGSQSDDKIAWFENDGSENFTEHIVSVTAESVVHVRSGDIDGDGDIDLASGAFSNNFADSKFAWYENDGTQNFTEHVIPGPNPVSFEIVDLDNDGDNDFVVGSNPAPFGGGSDKDKLYWYENDGFANFTQHIISTTDERHQQIWPIDMDQDGDLDVVATRTGEFFWFENDGSQNFTEHEIGVDVNQPRATHAADMDGDGDVDLLVGQELLDEINMWINDGSQNFTEYPVATNQNLIWSVFPSDMDGDGDLDVVSASRFDSKVAWHENTTSTPPPHVYWTENLGTGFSGDDEIHRTDLDGNDFTQYYAGFAGEIAGIAIDTVNNQIFYTDAAQAEIIVGGIGGSGFATGPTKILDFDPSGANDLEDLALDVANQVIYFTHGKAESGFANSVSSVNYDGTGYVQLVNTVSWDPFGIDLDLANGKMYFTGNEEGQGNVNRLYRANLDGTAVEVVFETTTDGHFRGVAYDHQNEVVYWSWGEEDVPGGMIFYSDINAATPFIPTSFSFGGEPRGIDIDFYSNKLYWVCRGANDGATPPMIMRSNMDGSNIETTFTVTMFPSAYPPGPPGSGMIALDLRNPSTPSLPVPEIDLVIGGSTIPLSEGPIDVSMTNQGEDLVQSFSIVNSGTGTLLITDIQIGDDVLAGPSAWSIDPGWPTSVAPTSTADFTVTFSGANAGSFASVLTIINNDFDESTFTRVLGGTVNALPTGEIAVYDGPDNTGTNIISGQAGLIDFGTAAEGTDIVRSFTIENGGTNTLNITSISITGSAFALSGPPPATIGIGADTTISVVLSGLVPGTYTDTLTIVNDDPDESSFTFFLTGTITPFIITTPEIAVFEGADTTGISLIAGSASVSLGSGPVGTDLSQPVTIKNQGNADLTVSSIVSTDTSFSVDGTYPLVLASNATQVMQITLNGNSAGTFSDQLTITSDDVDEGSFVINLNGTILEARIALFAGQDTTGLPVVSGQTDPVTIGIAMQGESLSFTFAIENPGNTSLNIISITSDNPLLTISNTPTLVQPGEFLVFTVTVDTSEPQTIMANLTISSDLGDFVFPVQANVQAMIPEQEVVVFNAISPNGDDIHDYLKIQGISQFPGAEVLIFNKVGSLVYSTTTYDNNIPGSRFDGTGNQGNYSELAAGTYYYLIDLKDGSELVKGYLVLNR